MSSDYSSESASGSGASANVFGRLAAALLFLPALGALAWAVSLHPFGPLIPSVLVAVYCAVLLRWPHVWLFLVPAILPVIDLTRLTGAMLVTDSDILLLSTIAMGCFDIARRRARPDPEGRVFARLSFVSLLLLILISASYAVSAWKGFMPFALPDAQLADYHSRWNALRVAKGFFLPLLLLPSLIRALREMGGRATDLFGWGLAASLATVTATGVYERVAFPGFWNFSADYRITAPFWEMNVGGAALDGWLALCLPFALWAVLQVRRAWSLALALALAALAFYVALVTFSRGVYAACFISLLFGSLAWLSSGSLAARGRRWGSVLVGLLLALALVWAALTVFRNGGYRTLAAFIALVPALHITAVAAHRCSPGALVSGVLVFILAAAVEGGLFLFVDKGAYLAFGLVTLLFFMSAWFWQRDPARGQVGGLLGLSGGLLLGMALCAQHWGGAPALTDSLWVVAGLVMLLLVVCLREQPLPRWQPRQTLAIFGVAGVLSFAVVVPGGYYMGSRFATSHQDMGLRQKHWRDSVAWLESDLDWVIGKGVGRYPETFLWRSTTEEAPGTYAIPAENGGHFLRLMAAPHAMGWGEVLRVSQIIAPSSTGNLKVMAEVRTKQDIRLFFEVCQRHMLYATGCAVVNTNITAMPDVWQPVSLELKDVVQNMGPYWYAPRPPVFAVALESRGTSADVRNLRLLDPLDGDRLRNGDFSAQENFWFSSSDHDHLPWHIKSLPLNVLFDQGLVGVSLFGVLWCAVLLRLMSISGTWTMAPFLLASFSGFLTVGLFDSLIDVPRLAVLFYLMSFFSLTAKPQYLHGQAGGRAPAP